MHLCGACAGELVQAAEWSEGEGRAWRVELRCPECGWSASGTFNQHEIDDYDRRLDDGMRSLIDDLRKLTAENMEAETEEFVSALASELILPEDF